MKFWVPFMQWRCCSEPTRYILGIETHVLSSPVIIMAECL